MATPTELQRLYCAGTWFQMKTVMPQVVNGHAVAYFLSYLLNVAGTVQAETRRDGWFYRLTEDIELDTGFNHDAQRRHVMALEALDVLEVKRMGNPPRRWFRVNIVRLHEMVSVAEEELATKRRTLHAARQAKVLETMMDEAEQRLVGRVP